MYGKFIYTFFLIIFTTTYVGYYGSIIIDNIKNKK